MAKKRKLSWREVRQSERKRNLFFAAILLVIITLIVIMAIAGLFPGNRNKEESAPAADLQTETETESETEGTEDPDNTEESEMMQTLLNKGEVPRINELMEAYCLARETCDVETMYQLYGRTDTNGMERERERMLLNARYIQSFKNIVCYTAKGLEEGSWLVYTSADIKFYKAETLAPLVMWCYVTTGDDGTLTITDPEELTADQQKFVKETAKSQDARNLALQVNTRLTEAVAADPDLAKIYHTLNAGSPLWETEAAEIPPDVRILPE